LILRFRFVISVAVVKIFIVDRNILAVSDELGLLFAGGKMSLSYSCDSSFFGLFKRMFFMIGVSIDCPNYVLLSDLHIPLLLIF